jgi:hypothetical protein
MLEAPDRHHQRFVDKSADVSTVLVASPDDSTGTDNVQGRLVVPEGSLPAADELGELAAVLRENSRLLRRVEVRLEQLRALVGTSRQAS